MHPGQSLSARSMARHNRDVILDLLRSSGPLSRMEIREQVGASTATVNRLTTDLLERGLIVSEGTAPSTGGRRSLMVRFNERAACVAAVDVGSSVVRGALVDLRGGIERRVEQPTAPGLGARERMEHVREVTSALLDLARDQGQRCIAVGAGVPGVVDAEGEVGWAPALGWHEVALSRVLEDSSGLPVTVENDANTLAIAEHRHGDARGTASLVALNLGNGIGAGIIADGALYRGHTFAAGEVGYMLLGPTSLKQTYAGFGDLESRVGGEGITSRSRQLGLGSEGHPLSAAGVFELARTGHAIALGLVEEISDQLAVAVANLAAVLDPGVVVLGGGIGASADMLIPRLRDRLHGRIPHVPELLPPSLGRDGVLIGAAEMALDSLGSLDGALGGGQETPARG